MTERARFDLRTEPWVLSRYFDGTVRELSLIDIFSEASKIRDLVGDVPTQVFAITRLLLAVLHRSLPPIEHPVEDWAELWEADGLPVALIEEYLADPAWADRFDLLHPERPFYQVAALRTAKDETFGLERLIADVPNGEQFFSTRRGRGIESLSFAEAARWLVHCQAFDVSGIKSGAIDDPRVSGGKGYPIGTGWAGELGGLLLEGKNLRETLLLNLVLGTAADSPVDREDFPVWERAPQSGAPEAGPGGSPRVPTGQADIFTWQSRRIRLVEDGGRVTRVLICNGDQLKPQDRYTVETMTVWRRSAAQEKKLNQEPVYMPRLHYPERSFWRGIGALLPQTADEKQNKGGSLLRPAETIHWLATLRNHEILNADLVVTTHAFGMSYGTQSSVVTEIVEDALPLRLAVLVDTERELGGAVKDLVEATDKAVFALAKLSENLKIAAGGEPESGNSRAKELAYFELDPQFRRWLESLDSATVVDDAVYQWSVTAEQIIRRIGRSLIADAGDAAWVGRERALGGHISSSEADEWFRRALRSALPEAIRHQEKDDTMTGPNVHQVAS